MFYPIKEKVLICISSLICILIIFIFDILNILVTLDIIKDYLEEYTHKLDNPIFVLCFIVFINLAFLFIITFKIFIKTYKNNTVKRKLYHCSALIFFLVYMILYYPYFYILTDLNIWIILNFIAVIFIFFYLVDTFHPYFKPRT